MRDHEEYRPSQGQATDIFLLKNSADPDSLAFARSVSELLHVFAIQPVSDILEMIIS